MALIALHVTGALYHVLVRRDGLLRRMWFGRRIAPARIHDTQGGFA
jgi:cytochrome b561